MYNAWQSLYSRQVAWFLDGEAIEAVSDRWVIEDDGYRIRLAAAGVGDAARYSCRATNVAGQSDKFYDLSVLGEYCSVCYMSLPQCLLSLLHVPPSVPLVSATCPSLSASCLRYMSLPQCLLSLLHVPPSVPLVSATCPSLSASCLCYMSLPQCLLSPLHVPPSVPLVSATCPSLSASCLRYMSLPQCLLSRLWLLLFICLAFDMRSFHSSCSCASVHGCRRDGQYYISE
jgi:hypothetical protein